MQVLIGNPNPVLPAGETTDAPCVTYVDIPTGEDHYPEGHHGYVQNLSDGLSGDDLRLHLADSIINRDGVTHLPGHEAVLAIAHPTGIWRQQARPGTIPTFVVAEDPEVSRILADFWQCPDTLPTDLEETHYTFHNGVYVPGDAPGVDQTGAIDLQANITQNGRDIQARNAFGFQVGVTGTGSAATGTTLTTTTTTSSTSQFNGQRVFVFNGTAMVWGNIQSCTSGANAVLTVDRWYAPGTPGGVAGTTPASGFQYVIADGGAPAWFMALSANTTALATPSTNSTLPGEITTAGGGMVRQICPWAHTASAATTTLTPVYTANGSDALPVAIGSIGTFSSMVPGATVSNMYFNTLLSVTATLSAIGDQLTVTQTITGT